MATMSKTLVAFSAVGLIAAASLMNSASAMERDHVVDIGEQIAAVSSSGGAGVPENEMVRTGNGFIFRDR